MRQIFKNPHCGHSPSVAEVHTWVPGAEDTCAVEAPHPETKHQRQLCVCILTTIFIATINIVINLGIPMRTYRRVDRGLFSSNSLSGHEA